MKTSRVDIPALKAAHPLGDFVVASGVKLNGEGRRVRQGLCPFHEEKEGSFTVYADTERWYCFGCGAGGDVLDFVQRREGVGLAEAIALLGAGRPSLSPAAGRASPAGRRLKTDRRAAPVPSPYRDVPLLTSSARFYVGAFRRNNCAKRYIASRGIAPSAALRIGTGFAPGGGLRRSLRSAGFSESRMDASGLFTARGAERFAGMVVAPETDVLGRVIWLAGRAVKPSAKPRFQALPGAKPVLGLGRLGAAPERVVVAEGLMDWLALAAWNIPACAALGTHGVDRVAEALRVAGQVFLAFDSDDAGSDAARHLERLLGGRAAVAELPSGIGDVGELAQRADGRARFMEMLRRAASRRRETPRTRA